MALQIVASQPAGTRAAKVRATPASGGELTTKTRRAPAASRSEAQSASEPRPVTIRGGCRRGFSAYPLLSFERANDGAVVFGAEAGALDFHQQVTMHP
jgi:hypothetical protein